VFLTSSLLIVNIFGIFFLFYKSNYDHEGIRKAGLNVSLTILIITIFMLSLFDRSTPWLQFGYYNSSVGLTGVDGISLFFLVLTGLLVALCLLTG
jgi:NADH-quinone oxidoreductase subunit M